MWVVTAPLDSTEDTSIITESPVGRAALYTKYLGSEAIAVFLFIHSTDVCWAPTMTVLAAGRGRE